MSADLSAERAAALPCSVNTVGPASHSHMKAHEKILDPYQERGVLDCRKKLLGTFLKKKKKAKCSKKVSKLAILDCVQLHEHLLS